MAVLNLAPLKDITEGDPDYEKELLGDLFADSEEIIESMKSSFQSSDPQTFGALAHKLKGCIAYVGGEDIMGRLYQAEQNALKKNALPSEAEFILLVDGYEQVKNEISLYIESLG